MSDATNELMYTNDALLKYCKFYTGHRVESIQTTLFITSCQSQSETRSNRDTNNPKFVNHVLAVDKGAM